MPFFRLSRHRILKSCVGGLLLWLAATGLAGPSVQPEPAAAPVPLNVVATDASTVFPSEINHQGTGRSGACHSTLDLTRRIPITGNWFFQVGANLERFDFGTTERGPLPTTLQTFNVPIGIVNITQEHVGFLAQLRPGFFFEHEVTRGAFDIPFEIGSFIPVIDEQLYVAWGMRAALLQKYGVFPMGGVIWVIHPKLILYGHLPEPRLEYTVNEQWLLWTGGECIGGSFKMDANDTDRIGGTVVQYCELRGGLGATYIPAKGWNLKLAAGYAFERKFDFYRAQAGYVANPAPYVRLQASAEF